MDGYLSDSTELDCSNSSSSANWSFDSHDLSSDSETDSLLAEEKLSPCIQIPITEHDEKTFLTE